MWTFLAFAALTVFLLGLVQWARSGAGIWRIRSIRRSEGTLSTAEKREAEAEVQRLERSTDRLLLMSLKLVGVVALLVWVVLGVSMVIDALGLNDWMNDLSMRAHRYWSTGVPDRGSHSSVERQNMLRNIGAGLRK
ncbi:MAG: hypothetical protein IJ702_03195 [Fretibacterium sp.]|nr:hypothetical protein [Fretibacterium sp.]